MLTPMNLALTSNTPELSVELISNSTFFNLPHTTTQQHSTAGSAPDTPHTMDSSSLGARRRLGHDATEALACA